MITQINTTCHEELNMRTNERRKEKGGRKVERCLWRIRASRMHLALDSSLITGLICERRGSLTVSRFATAVQLSEEKWIS